MPNRFIDMMQGRHHVRAIFPGVVRVCVFVVDGTALGYEVADTFSRPGDHGAPPGMHALASHRAEDRRLSLQHGVPLLFICPPPPSIHLQAAYAAAAQAQAVGGPANFTAPPSPPPEQSDLPRLGFISYDMHEALFPGGPSLYDVALAFGNKGYPGGLVFALNQVPAAVHKFDVVFTAGVRLLIMLGCGHPAVHWCRFSSRPCPNTWA